LSIYSVVFLAWWITAAVRPKSADPAIFNWSAITRMVTGHVLVVLLQLEFLVAIFGIEGPAAYSAALIWYLIHSAQQFTRMLYVRPKTDLGS